MIFNDIVTLINHYYDAITREDRFNKTILTDCMWRRKSQKSVSNNQIQIADYISITIPFRDGYVPPNVYQKLPNDEKKKYFTLNTENNMDIVILGEVMEDVFDYSSLQEIEKKYEYHTIAGVSDNTLVYNLKHWKVDAK